MKLPKFDYAVPTTIDEAVAMLTRAGGTARVIAGGQSLMPMLAFRLSQPSLLVDLRRLRGLDKITVSADGVHLGAKTRWVDIERCTELAAAHPLLRAAIKHVAHVQIRTRGTVGGSLAHADPAAELPCVAVLCDATVEVFGTAGARHVPARAFFTGPLSTVLEPDELVTGLHLPAWPADRLWAFDEFSRRRGDFALAGIGLFLDLRAGAASDVHIAAFGVGDTPLRLSRAEAALEGKRLREDAIAACCKAAQLDLDPKDDIHGSAAYRRALTDHLLGEALRALARKAGQ